MKKQPFWFPTWSDTNQAVKLQKMARGLKFRIEKVEVTAKMICVFFFRICKKFVFA